MKGPRKHERFDPSQEPKAIILYNPCVRRAGFAGARAAVGDAEVPTMIIEPGINLCIRE